MRPLVIAHRGASGSELENSLAAFRAAAAQRADGVELDVHATADGELIVHHDETIDGTHHIAHSTARAIAALRLANSEPIPTLSQALAAIPPPLRVFVEVKSLAPRWDERLFETLDRGPNPAGYAVHSFDHRIVRRLGGKRPNLTCGVLASAYLIRPLTAMEDAGASILWQERSVVDDLLVRTVHGAGARVFVWTVDDPAEMARLIGWGVDGICTNFPERARRAVDAPQAA
ncbi:MAG TPA: glycerophosphodiester phosphodiesterase [Gemmatimonadales bacterium]|nr:glycerophosphodiester phosphodiesterase [Gemmatimonadales bacterium]